MVKLSHYRLLGLQGIEGPRIYRQSVHVCGKVVSPRHWPPLPQKISLVLISVTGWVDSRAIVLPEGLSQWKISMTPIGIELATFRLIVQNLNQLHTVDRRPLYLSFQCHTLARKFNCFNINNQTWQRKLVNILPYEWFDHPQYLSIVRRL